MAMTFVSPIEEHDSAACFGTIKACVNHVTSPLARSTSVSTLLLAVGLHYKPGLERALSRRAQWVGSSILRLFYLELAYCVAVGKTASRPQICFYPFQYAMFLDLGECHCKLKLQATCCYTFSSSQPCCRFSSPFSM